jgi:hypothetical protein
MHADEASHLDAPVAARIEQLHPLITIFPFIA